MKLLDLLKEIKAVSSFWPRIYDAVEKYVDEQIDYEFDNAEEPHRFNREWVTVKTYIAFGYNDLGNNIFAVHSIVDFDGDKRVYSILINADTLEWDNFYDERASRWFEKNDYIEFPYKPSLSEIKAKPAFNFGIFQEVMSKVLQAELDSYNESIYDRMGEDDFNEGYLQEVPKEPVIAYGILNDEFTSVFLESNSELGNDLVWCLTYETTNLGDILANPYKVVDIEWVYDIEELIGGYNQVIWLK
jgi:hypothetical protein